MVSKGISLQADITGYLSRLRKSSRLAGWQTSLSGMALLVIFIASLALVQFSTPDLTGTDGYYHIKLASLMRTDGLRPDFPWLPLTILNPREFYDHHFLFHVALIPFSGGDLRLGAKWAAVAFSSLAFLSVWWLLRNQRVRYAGLWALGLLAVSEAFLYRMSMVRAQSLSLGILALGLHWMLTGKHRRLLPLGFIYVWMYDAFPLLVVLAGLYVVAAWSSERKLDLQPLLYAGLGIGLGMVINPYFPHNIAFVIRHILPKLTEATAVSVGNEWYPYKTTQLLENSPLALGLFLSGTFALGLSGRRMQVRTATAFLIAIAFGAMLFQARRFIEYFPAFALIFAAFAWSPLLSANGETGNPEKTPTQRALASGTFGRFFAGGAVLLILIAGLWGTLGEAKASVARSRPYQRFAGASAWLVTNTPPGSRLFQTDWDDFPRLFFHNTHNTYLVGLDPTYLQISDPQLYDLWVAISDGDIENPSTEILAHFGAAYAISDLNHKDFLRGAQADPGMEEVYRDDEAVIFRLKAAGQ